jgi:hypothetical protein
MTRRARIWRIVAALFTIINLVGAGFAVAAGEWPHTGVHVVLAVLGGYWMSRLAAGRVEESLPSYQSDEPRLAPEQQRLEQLQQSVDAIAVEVERIGEAQRFDARLKQERSEPER